MVAVSVVDQEREAAARRVVGAAGWRRRDVSLGRGTKVGVELVDEALPGKADDQRAGNDQRGGEQQAERQQQPRS
jgi:hypothetical protein